MSGNCELGRGLRRREKTATEAGARRFEKPALDARAAPPEAHQSLISRKTGADVPLTGLSFILQRPLHYAFYGLVALLVSLPALAAAGVFADATGTLALWAASFGMGHDRTATVLDGIGSAGPAAAAPWGARAIALWMQGLEAILSSFGWGYFWAIATAGYLLLRRDVDGTECDEVVLEEPIGGI